MKSLNYLLELQPDITCEGFKVRRGMTDVQKKKIIQTNTVVTSAQCAN